MNLKYFIKVAIVMVLGTVQAQHDITIEAELDVDDKQLQIEQEIVYLNDSEAILTEIFLNDWANSFSSKTTPLAKRFAENYWSSFHFEKDEERGRTYITNIWSEDNVPFHWERAGEADVIRVKLNDPLMPGDAITLNLKYIVKLPNSKLTRYGVDKSGSFKLRYWFISPASFDGKWHAYSNKNTDDLYISPSQFSISMRAPENYSLSSDLDIVEESVLDGIKTTVLQGDERMRFLIYLEKNTSFETISTDKVDVITNLEARKVTDLMRALIVDRIVHFLDEKLGEYPFDKILVSDEQYRSSPVYGLNQLPNFISPFPDGFEYDMEQLKTLTANYLKTTLPLHPRDDHWLVGAMQIYLMTEYVDTYYPNMKIIGSLSNFWVIRWSHASKLEFNDQYPLLYLNMARNNLNQSLTTPRDSLVKFNKNIANDYYAGEGLQYLANYIGRESLETSLKQFYNENKLTRVHSSRFENVLSRHTELPVNWFFDDYINSRSPIDFRIKKVERAGDSLKVTVKNRFGGAKPFSLFGLNKDSIVFKQWLPLIDSTATVTVPAKGVKKLALDYDQQIPEYNRRNNYKKVSGILNRPIQLRLFQDVQDPRYNQLFFMPVFQYNLYDGFTMGPKMYNKTVLPKPWYYKIQPLYGFESKTIVGSASVIYTHRVEESSLYAIRGGASGSYFSYNDGLFYRRITPFLTFAFRTKDLRDNEKQFINLRSVNVSRDSNPLEPDQDPNYSVVNLQYVYSNPNLINYFRGVADYQIASKFSKISATVEYRKLFLNNRQLNLRFYGGVFLYNNTEDENGFFDFALDRPTDYLFDYNYYGRSEESGLFSQQLIIAEGGFKSQLEPAFSNNWMATVNASTNLWKWIYIYGDAGLVHNKGEDVEFVYDSGIRLSFVADYFELYFPLYSSLGWEPSLPNYDQKIRFIVTLSLDTLFKLFTREWY